MRPADFKAPIILGAGLSGLSAAYHLGPNTRIYEAAARIGGECATDVIRNYYFDRSGHLLHFHSPQTRRLLHHLLPQTFKRIERDARIHLLGREVRYPMQANTFGLPAEIKAQCLWDYLAAAVSPGGRATNFSAWAQKQFGTYLANIFFEPYNRKLWTIPAQELTLEWMGAYVPKPDLATVIRGAFADVPDGGGYNASFFYPKKGGIDILARVLAAPLTGLRLNARAIHIDQRRRSVQIMNVGTETWGNLVSTLPLPALVEILDCPPLRVQEAAGKLRANSVLVVNLGIRRKGIHSAHWVYFPEAKYVFYRIGFPSNFGQVAPLGRSSLYAEVALPAGTGWRERKQLARKVKMGLVEAGILQSEDKLDVEHFQYIPYAYVIFDKNYKSARKIILDYLETCGIQSIGRWGAWEYSAMEDAILAGRAAAKKVTET